MKVKFRCFIGLGSNLDDPIQQVSSALNELALLDKCELINASSLYASAPVGPQDQPDFINAVAEIETELSPEALLDQLQLLEQKHQRIRERHWGPRTLDLDILLYGHQIIETERLSIPHPYMYERSFVLYPLAEINPHLSMPKGLPLSELLTACPMGSLLKI
ncbi:2-amino-4-hydroxy-6-hydroxymethyldihydropteridine diphosphokinase [Neptuniibacter sp. 1_MG-2023]|jgi:2-amino-4-hydroxy-6-hydroxymethyldihydropteridine diphosphokinase|uniref:2-amino-4-hydroxy-6- hydroxymethyldihydropteridine diphosphokinase n=1 Tax=Neptuniibacter sp. 1_MG-2023 TaxID=3062662 RepID=UPI0026E4155E|nr:2-amino-4-hydroxy-6-hydroxymethyldihydropteridine diphosphokinase [Neptuniibacter sp. 1_MG-2023]MDO6594993.1 2-amino-4-hydroxy-6-hydroxymethyldihydropteridine diphosphokinase [Neptuniibacter sp. 1_MG-2023]